MGDISKHLSDPDFQALPQEAQLQILKEEDPEFGSFLDSKNAPIVSSHESKDTPHNSIQEFTDNFAPTALAKAGYNAISDRANEFKQDPLKAIGHTASDMYGTFLGIPQAKMAAGMYQNLKDRSQPFFGKAMTAPDTPTALLRGAQGVLASAPVLGDAMSLGDRMVMGKDSSAGAGLAGQLANLALPGMGELAESKLAAIPKNSMLRILRPDPADAVLNASKYGKVADTMLENPTITNRAGLYKQYIDKTKNAGEDVGNYNKMFADKADQAGVKISPDPATDYLKNYVMESKVTDPVTGLPMPADENRMLAASKVRDPIDKAFRIPGSNGQPSQYVPTDVRSGIDLKQLYGSRGDYNPIAAHDPDIPMQAEASRGLNKVFMNQLNDASKQVFGSLDNPYVKSNENFTKNASVRDLLAKSFSGNDDLAGKMLGISVPRAVGRAYGSLKSNVPANLVIGHGANMLSSALPLDMMAKLLLANKMGAMNQ